MLVGGAFLAGLAPWSPTASAAPSGSHPPSHRSTETGYDLFAVVAADGSLARGSAGTTVTHRGTGRYDVKFAQPVADCAVVANLGYTGDHEEFTFKSVKEGGRAAKMGVQKGDVLKKVAGQDLTRLREVTQFAREADGDTVTFTFQRGDKTFDATAKKADLPAPPQRGDRGGNQTPRDTVPPAGGTGGPPPAGNGGNGGGGNNGNGGGRDGEVHWEVGVTTPPGVAGTFTFSKAETGDLLWGAGVRGAVMFPESYYFSISR